MARSNCTVAIITAQNLNTKPGTKVDHQNVGKNFDLHHETCNPDKGSLNFVQMTSNLAIWLLPVNNVYGDWPASGEIDIVESRGNLDYKDWQGISLGVDHMGSTLHWGPFYPFNMYHLTTGLKHAPTGEDWATTFHKYVVEWTSTDMRFFVDDALVVKIDPGPKGFYEFGGFAEEIPNTHNPWENSPNKMAPWDQDFHLIMNVAVGGTGGYFHDSITNQPYPKPWNDSSSTAVKDFWEAKDLWYPTWNPTKNNGEDAAMQVDYVRVWADGTYTPTTSL
ncbi:beta-1,3-glucan-binding protein-like [Amphiura filiformis]|uniref:beta-1,3-glucan-binding protein-like n=1 Tax=Amphiura filiformis TaxID=82378 RepID=UPI003B213631